MFSGVRRSVTAVDFVVILVVSAVMILALDIPASAAADVPAASTEIKNVAGRCLDSNTTVVTISNCTGVRSQQWFVKSGTTLQNAATLLCLESDDNKQVNTNYCSSSSSYQQWARNSGTTLRSLATGFCLSSSGDKEVRTDQCDDSVSQKWSGV